MIPVESLLAAILVAAFPTLALSRLVAESELFEPLRTWITLLAAERLAYSRSTWWLMPAMAMLCRFCSSWWIAMPVSVASTMACGAQPLLIPLVYLAAIGMADALAKDAT